MHNDISQTPGAIYNPGFNPKHTNAPVYSFGFKREKKGQSALMMPTSTPGNVGPGLYDPDKRSISTQKAEVKVKFNATAKMALEPRKTYVHETYEDYSAIGQQLRSKKTTEGRVKFDKAQKNVSTGVFKQDLATQMPKLNLAHAHY